MDKKKSEIKRLPENLVTFLSENRPVPWQEIPDIPLYMDQVIEYMKRQHIGLLSGESLTSSMVNNYIKKGLLPRATGKKYGREHIAYLTAICLLKQVLPVEDVAVLMKAQLEEKNVEDFYLEYCNILDLEFSKRAQEVALVQGPSQALDIKADEDSKVCESNVLEAASPQSLVLRLAVSSYSKTLTCKKLLDEI